MMMPSSTQATMTVKKEVLHYYCFTNLPQVVDIGVGDFIIYGRDSKKCLMTLFFVHTLWI